MSKNTNNNNNINDIERENYEPEWYRFNRTIYSNLLLILLNSSYNDTLLQTNNM